MKRLFVMFVLICCAVMVQAQYVDQKEAKADGNRPLAEFVTLKKVLWNFDWEYSSGKNGGMLIFPMIFSSSSRGLKMAAGNVSMSLPMPRRLNSFSMAKASA